MSGGSIAHSILGVRLVSALDLSLRGGNCTVVNSDVRVQIAVQGPYVYPDASVYCGKPLLADEYAEVLLNPVAVFEVLCKSSEAYDRGYKFAQYRQIASLREYVLISQTEPRVEVFSKGPDARWMFTEFVGEKAVCQLSSIGCEIAFADLYRNVPQSSDNL